MENIMKIYGYLLLICLSTSLSLEIKELLDYELESPVAQRVLRDQDYKTDFIKVTETKSKPKKVMVKQDDKEEKLTKAKNEEEPIKTTDVEAKDKKKDSEIESKSRRGKKDSKSPVMAKSAIDDLAAELEHAEPSISDDEDTTKDEEITTAVSDTNPTTTEIEDTEVSTATSDTTRVTEYGEEYDAITEEIPSYDDEEQSTANDAIIEDEPNTTIANEEASANSTKNVTNEDAITTNVPNDNDNYDIITDQSVLDTLSPAMPEIPVDVEILTIPNASRVGPLPTSLASGFKDAAAASCMPCSSINCASMDDGGINNGSSKSAAFRRRNFNPMKARDVVPFQEGPESTTESASSSKGSTQATTASTMSSGMTTKAPPNPDGGGCKICICEVGNLDVPLTNENCILDQNLAKAMMSCSTSPSFYNQFNMGLGGVALVFKFKMSDAYRWAYHLKFGDDFELEFKGAKYNSNELLFKLKRDKLQINYKFDLNKTNGDKVTESTQIVGRVTKLLSESEEKTIYVLSFGNYKMISPIGPKKSISVVEKMCHSLNMTKNSSSPCDDPSFGPIFSVLKYEDRIKQESSFGRQCIGECNPGPDKYYYCRTSPWYLKYNKEAKSSGVAQSDHPMDWDICGKQICEQGACTLYSAHGFPCEKDSCKPDGTIPKVSNRTPYVCSIKKGAKSLLDNNDTILCLGSLENGKCPDNFAMKDYCTPKTKFEAEFWTGVAPTTTASTSSINTASSSPTTEASTTAATSSAK